MVLIKCMFIVTFRFSLVEYWLDCLLSRCQTKSEWVRSVKKSLNLLLFLFLDFGSAKMMIIELINVFVNWILLRVLWTKKLNGYIDHTMPLPLSLLNYCCIFIFLLGYTYKRSLDFSRVTSFFFEWIVEQSNHLHGSADRPHKCRIWVFVSSFYNWLTTYPCWR